MLKKYIMLSKIRDYRLRFYHKIDKYMFRLNAFIKFNPKKDVSDNFSYEECFYNL